MLYAENSIQEMKKEDIVNKLSSNPLYEQVFNRIKDSVRSGEYKKGDLIPSEKELMELMGVSRVTVRQALKMLSDSGIIETRKGKGSIVAVDWKSILDPGELRDQAETYWHLFEQSTLARRVIEPSIAKQAAIMATEQDIRQLEYAFEHDSETTEQAEPSIRIRKGTGLPRLSVGNPEKSAYETDLGSNGAAVQRDHGASADCSGTAGILQGRNTKAAWKYSEGSQRP